MGSSNTYSVFFSLNGTNQDYVITDLSMMRLSGMYQDVPTVRQREPVRRAPVRTTNSKPNKPAIKATGQDAPTVHGLGPVDKPRSTSTATNRAKVSPVYPEPIPIFGGLISKLDSNNVKKQIRPLRSGGFAIFEVTVDGQQIKMFGNGKGYSRNNGTYTLHWTRIDMNGARQPFIRNTYEIALRAHPDIKIGNTIWVRGEDAYVEIFHPKAVQKMRTSKALAGVGLLFLVASGLEAWNLYRKNGVDDPEFQSLALRMGLGAIDPTRGFVSGAIADTLADHSSSFFQNLTNPFSLLFNALSLTSLAPALPGIGLLTTIL